MCVPILIIEVREWRITNITVADEIYLNVLNIIHNKSIIYLDAVHTITTI